MVGSLLVVDDDASVRGLVVRILRSWGHEMIGEAGSVAEALAYADTWRPETALVDVGLPDGDGFSLTRLLRARPWAMRVVIFSSDADPSNKAAAARAGAIGFFPKDELLSDAMQHLLEGRADDER